MKFYNTSPVVLIAQESTFSLETPKEKVSPQCVVDFFFFCGKAGIYNRQYTDNLLHICDYWDFRAR